MTVMARAENIVKASHTVEIDAPARVVWEVLVDLDNYHLGNSFCPSDPLWPADRRRSALCRYSTPDTGETVPVFEYLVACDPEQLLSWSSAPFPRTWTPPARPVHQGHRCQRRCSYFTTDISLGLNQDTIMREHGARAKKSASSRWPGPETPRRRTTRQSLLNALPRPKQ